MSGPQGPQGDPGQERDERDVYSAIWGCQPVTWPGEAGTPPEIPTPPAGPLGMQACWNEMIPLMEKKHNFEKSVFLVDRLHLSSISTPLPSSWNLQDLLMAIWLQQLVPSTLQCWESSTCKSHSQWWRPQKVCSWQNFRRWWTQVQSRIEETKRTKKAGQLSAQKGHLPAKTM